MNNLALVHVKAATEEDLKTKRGIIYVILNTMNGKRYVGQTRRTFVGRYKYKWWKNLHNIKLKRAVKKYGRSVFKIFILHDGVNSDHLNSLEIFYIYHFKSKKDGYNIEIGGRSGWQYATSDFIEKSKKIHGSKYDYFKSVYTGVMNKIEIICPIHGSFWQPARTHMIGAGCHKCNTPNKMKNEDFLIEAKKVFPQYDYSLVDYQKSRGKVRILCPTHEIFEIIPSVLLSGKGCPQCFPRKRNRQVAQLNQSNEIIQTFPSAKIAAEVFKINRSVIHSVCCGFRKTYKGFFFGNMFNRGRFLDSLPQSLNKMPD